MGAGCGGTLLKHAEDGQEVILVVLSRLMDDERTDGSEALRRGAELLEPGRPTRVSRTALTDVTAVRSYLTATTTQEFRASVFEDISETLVEKMEALTAYREVASDRTDLTPRFVQATARYWGRFADVVDVEPFEIPQRGQDA